ncbi:hypothetical protein [Xanthomonas pisi]|uniref:hypothetical protein n=1 Tax=Xanthomonas pisi TaxID=56457 RepID=UPI000AB3BEB9|nr:hypothetical protein [Xanthomonas pisi]
MKHFYGARKIEKFLRSMKTLLGTLLLVAGACLLGAGISASAATFGLTKFADDRRGE